MNKVFNINLGGYPFTIDDNAYQHLSGYLKTIHQHFKHSEGYEEITSDIETRIAELFQESLGNHSIVTSKMVEEAIVIMGTPEEFGAEPIDNFEESTTTHQSSRKKRNHNYKTGKRLFRDPEDQVIGGVCSGVAAYFGISDPLWVRIFFILFTISGGVGIPAYIILWAILPEAKTSSDRLAMKGADINISNMAKIVEEEVEHLTDKISEMSEGWDTSGKKKSTAEKAAFKQNIREIFQLFGKGIRTGIAVLSTVIKPIIFIVGFALIIAFAAIWLAAIISFFVGFPLLNFMLPQQSLVAGLWIFNVAVFIGVPILSLILLASRLVFKTRFSVRWKTGLIAFYILNAVSFFGISSYMLSQFSVEAESHLSAEEFSIEGNVLQINFTDNPYENTWIQLGPHGMLKLAGDQLITENIYLQIEKSDDDVFSLTKDTKSRGTGIKEARMLSSNIQHQASISKGQLNIQPYITLNKGEKWRNQQVFLTLKVPEGKSVKFDNLHRTRGYMVDYVDENNRHHHLFWAKNGKEYKMEKTGLLGEGSPRPPKKADYDFGDKYQDFSRIHIEGKMKIHIEHSDQFSTKLIGRDQYLRKVEVKQYDEVLKITMPLKNTSAPVHLHITMPNLSEVDLENTDDADIAGFKETAMTIRSESKGDIKAYVDVEDLTVKLDGRNELDIRGKGKKLTAYLNNRAKLDAERFVVDIADVKATERASAKLAVADTLRQVLDKRSTVRVEGEPLVLNN